MARLILVDAERFEDLFGQVLGRLAELKKGQDELQDELHQAVLGEDEEEPRCPHCGSAEVENTTCMGEPTRLTCSDCERSWTDE